jgi:hypothetical protein
MISLQWQELPVSVHALIRSATPLRLASAASTMACSEIGE